MLTVLLEKKTNRGREVFCAGKNEFGHNVRQFTVYLFSRVDYLRDVVVGMQ